MDDLAPARPPRAASAGRLAAGRLLRALAVLLVVTVGVFTATALAAGDAASARLGPVADPAAVAALRAELGLDQPPVDRYLGWLAGAARGDLGASLISGRPVSALIADRLGNSVILAAVAAIVLTPLALLLGAWAGLRPRRRPDRVVGAASVVLLALPEFVVGVALISVFAVGLGWLPAVSYLPEGSSPLLQPSVLVLPVAALTLASLAPTVRLVRAGVSVASAADAAASARLNGVPEARVVRCYVLPAALPTALPMLARTLTYLLGGALVVETLFGYPGLASAMVEAVNHRDVPVVQALALLAAAATVAVNLCADLVARTLDPPELAR
ncbi:ABC transporter permease [Pilimelia columellifera]|uniref:ABC transporter permease n=1 Tax=Pilimelia columellifera subsp. columellifera TaxID=706583 RepID=A0ABP6AWS7_9ACTN